MAARTAWAICSANGWWSAFGKPRRGTATKAGPPVHDDLLASIDSHGVTRHVFTADAPNTVWLTDISEHKTAEGKDLACAGWLAVEGVDHLGVRLAVITGALPGEALHPGPGWPALFDSFEEMAATQAACIPKFRTG